jgi:hypothetical protein
VQVCKTLQWNDLHWGQLTPFALSVFASLQWQGGRAIPTPEGPSYKVPSCSRALRSPRVQHHVQHLQAVLPHGHL